MGEELNPRIYEQLHECDEWEDGILAMIRNLDDEPLQARLIQILTRPEIAQIKIRIKKGELLEKNIPLADFEPHKQRIKELRDAGLKI